MYYQLDIVWNTGEREKHNYETPEKAHEILNGYFKAFGGQVVWAAVNAKRGKMPEKLKRGRD